MFYVIAIMQMNIQSMADLWREKRRSWDMILDLLFVAQFFQSKSIPDFKRKQICFTQQRGNLNFHLAKSFQSVQT
jgi:hypothetical protein